MEKNIENNKKTKRWKKWLKRGIITIFGLFLAIMLVIAALINFVFTPEKLTPELVKIINEHIEGEFQCQSTELTFFSSFPNFGVEITEGQLTSGQDTLLLFRSSNAEFNLRKLVLKRAIDIKNVSLMEASVNVLIDKNGKLNWDLLAIQNEREEEEEEEEEESISKFKINELSIKGLYLDKIKIVYANQLTNDVFRIDSLSTRFAMRYVQDEITCKLDADIKNIKFIKEGFVLLENTKAGIHTELTLFRKEHKLVFTEGGINLNGVDLLIDGFVQRDTVTNKFDTDLTLQLKVPNLKTALGLVPEKIVQKEKINIQGTVDFLTTVKGFYGKNEYPVTVVTASIRKGEFQYVDYPGSINKIEADFKTRLDFKDKESSYFNINSLDLKGFGVSLEGKLAVQNLMLNPFLKTTLKGNVDITKLNQVIPFSPDVTAQGSIDLDIETAFNVNEIKQQNIGSLQLKGNAILNDVNLTIPKDSLSIKIKQLHFDSAFEKRELLTGIITIKQLLLERTSERYINAENLEMDFRLDRTLTENTSLMAELKTGAVVYQGGADRKAELKGGEISVNIKSNRADRAKASIISNFALDSLGIYFNKRFAGIKGGKYKIKLQRNDQLKWSPQGTVHFEKMLAYSPTFGMPVRLENTTLTLKEKLLTLRNAKVTFGKSDVTLTGSIDNIGGLLSEGLKDEKVTAHLNLKSEFIDTNELMAAFNVVSKQMEKDKKGDTATSLGDILNQPAPKVLEEKRVVEIPKNIDFVFDSHINKMKFGKMDIDDIRGKFIIKDGKMQLSNAKMKMVAAELSTNINYTYLNEKEADVRFELNFNKVEMSRISEVLPVLDSLFPMTKSFEGLVDFRVKGIAKIDENMEIKIPSLKGIAAIQASNLMVFDSETFRELAKTFMFKSKDKNPIESLNVEMIISDSKLEVLPSFLAIDRYELVVGGIQNLDMSYDYHISVLKSPIPFKTGVDVTGSTLDDYKINLSKAKLKYYFTDSERLQKKADSTMIKKKASILKWLNFKK